jgi:Na+/proline symporter
VRKSKVLTAAEWMITRFSDDAGGRLARTSYALMAIVTLASFIGYAYEGIGKFMAIYIPLEHFASLTSNHLIISLVTTHESDVLAIIIFIATTVYVIAGGLLSVVVTDILQTLILSVSCVVIAWIAWVKMTPDMLAKLPHGFTSLGVPWRIPEFAGTANAGFEFFGAMVLIWVLKGFLLNAGGPGQMYDFQRFLAARSPKDAAKVGAAWSLFLILRWAMTMGIALLALTGAIGVTDSEQVMPVVLRDFLPIGMRGLVIAGLLSAFMSTFSATINSGAAFIVRDIWQPYFRKNATDAEAVRFSYWANVLLVVIGTAIGFQTKSIAQIWDWLMMALGGGVIIPNVLRWYWWRLNGWGYAFGTIGGMLLALVALFFPAIPMYIVFPSIVLFSLVICVVTSLLTKSVREDVLLNFYDTIRPFGLWKPIAEKFRRTGKQIDKKVDGFWLIAFNVFIAMITIFGMYVSPMYLIGHWNTAAAGWFAVAVVGCVILKFTWYDNLEEGETKA